MILQNYFLNHKIMKNIKILTIITILFVCFTSCKQNKDWKATQEEGTIDAYAEFCEKYPDNRHKKDIKKFLLNFIEENTDELQVLYYNFRLRHQPNLEEYPIINGQITDNLIKKLDENTKVSIIEQSKNKMKIHISGEPANTYWYKVKTETGIKGWIYGAGIGYNQEVGKACKLFAQQFPNEDLSKYPHCETNLWIELLDKDEPDDYHLVKNAFPNGIYTYAANQKILDNIFDDINFHKFEEYRMPYLSFLGNDIMENSYSPYFYYVDDFYKFSDDDIDEFEDIIQTEDVFKNDFDYYYMSFVPLNKNHIGLTVVEYPEDEDLEKNPAKEILFVFNNQEFESYEYISENKKEGFSVSMLFNNSENNVFLQHISYKKDGSKKLPPEQTVFQYSDKKELKELKEKKYPNDLPISNFQETDDLLTEIYAWQEDFNNYKLLRIDNDQTLYDKMFSENEGDVSSLTKYYKNSILCKTDISSMFSGSITYLANRLPFILTDSESERDNVSYYTIKATYFRHGHPFKTYEGKNVRDNKFIPGTNNITEIEVMDSKKAKNIIENIKKLYYINSDEEYENYVHGDI